jgi:putative phosphoribosyl transferase
VAYEIAVRLDAPLDVLVVRKIGAPMNPELAIGAVGEGGAIIVHPRMLEAVGMSEAELENQTARAREELTRLARRLRGEREPVDVAGRDVVLVDDGMATGSTAEVAARMLRQRDPSRITLAVPVASSAAVELLRPLADDLLVLRVPNNLIAVGEHFEDFSPVSSDDVIELLSRVERKNALNRGRFHA